MEKGETSQGHNSAITIGDKSYVVYHTKLNDGTLTHEVRVHELFTVDGCLIAAPYEYDPAIEQKGSYAKADVAASYDVIVQGYDTNKRYDPDTKKALAGATGLECETPSVIEFKEDGKVVKGETEVGTWSLANKNKLEVILTSAIDEGKADYTDTLAGTYEGYFMEQNVAGSAKTCFSAINKATGISIWGTMGVTPQQAIALTEKNMKVSIPASTRKNIALPTEGMSGATISWTSSNTEVLSNNGVVITPEQDTKVTLTRLFPVDCIIMRPAMM